MSAGRKLALLVVIALVLLLDQTSKSVVRKTLSDGMVRDYAAGIVTLTYTENPGAFLSLGSRLPPQLRTIIFDVIVAIGLVAAAIVLFLGKVTGRGDDIALAAIIGGGIGNLIDRVRFHGRVTDFIYMHAGPIHTGVFNVADMAITFGVLWLLGTWAFARRTQTP